MITQIHRLRQLVVVGAVLVAAALGAPLAAADPPTVPLPISASSTPRLGEQLSGRDRAWLTINSQGSALRLGEQLSGRDRAWLTSEFPQQPAPAGHVFAWDDAGIGAGATLALLLMAAGATLLIRGRALRPSKHALGR